MGIFMGIFSQKEISFILSLFPNISHSFPSYVWPVSFIHIQLGG